MPDKSPHSDVQSRALDLIVLGRAAVDFYGQQVGARLEDETSMAKYLGGSSGNIAFGTARQGLKSAMLTRVGNEHMGRSVRETLSRAGVDVSHVVTDPERLTALVILGIKDQETFPLIFYRENCADMAISTEDFDADFIQSARALVITGTHFSTEQVNRVSRQAIEYARAGGVRTVLDIDYRPVLWGLTTRGDGETRFISSESVTAHLQSIVPLFDLIVGTEEEFHIAGGSTDTLEALRNVRRVSDAVLVCKRGPLGCSVFTGSIPDDLDDGITVKGVRVDVLNVLGAGDAFMSGFLRGWIRGESYEQCCRYGNACGALVVSRHGCAPAMPTAEELDYYIANAEQIPRPDKDTHLNYLHRVTTRDVEWPELCVLAFDHRIQLANMAREVGAAEERIEELKQLILQGAFKGAAEMGLNGNAGILADTTYGQATLNELTGRGWWIGRPVELPGSRPLRFEYGNNIGQQLTSWPREHVVKCLVFYHPDDSIDLRLDQERKVADMYEACVNSGHEFLLEVIPPAGSTVDDQTLARALTRFYNIGIYPDWWKLPSPSRAAWQHIESVINQRAPHCRGVVLLGLDAPEEELRDGFNQAAGIEVCKGFAVGRTIFGKPSRQWLAGELNDQQLVDVIAGNYVRMIRYWRERKAPATAQSVA